jgi:hypothetical protein
MYAAAWSRERRSGRSPGLWGAGPLLGSARGLLFIPATPSGLVGVSAPAGPHLLGLIESTTPPSVGTLNLAWTEFLSSLSRIKVVSILCLLFHIVVGAVGRGRAGGARAAEKPKAFPSRGCGQVVERRAAAGWTARRRLVAAFHSLSMPPAARSAVHSTRGALKGASS